MSQVQSAQTGDPLACLVQRYRDGMAAYNAAPPRNDDEDGGAFVQATYGDPLDELGNHPPAPTTYEGALAGLDFVLKEIDEFSETEGSRAVLKVCLDFLRARLLSERT